MRVGNLLVNQKSWRLSENKQHARLEGFMYIKRKVFLFLPHGLKFISGLQKLRCLVLYDDSPVLICYMAILTKKLCTHHKHSLVLHKNIRERRAEKKSIITSILWWRRWESVMQLCHVDVDIFLQSEYKFPCQISVSSLRILPFSLTWHHHEQTDIKWCKIIIFCMIPFISGFQSTLHSLICTSYPSNHMSKVFFTKKKRF